MLVLGQLWPNARKLSKTGTKKTLARVWLCSWIQVQLRFLNMCRKSYCCDYCRLTLWFLLEVSILPSETKPILSDNYKAGSWCVSKVVPICFGFALQRHAIGLKIAHVLNQSDNAHTFSRALHRIYVFALSFDWLAGSSLSFAIG